MFGGLKIEFKEEHLPNENFFSWLKSNTTLFLGQIATLASLALFIASFSYYVLGHPAGQSEATVEEYLTYTQNSVFILNILFCFLFVVFTIYMLQKNKTGKHHSKLLNTLVFGKERAGDIEKELENKLEKHLKTFKENFLAYWFFLLGFYFFMALDFDWNELVGIKKEILAIAINGFLFVIPYWMFSVIIKSHAIKEEDAIKKNICFKWWFPLGIYAALFGAYFYVYHTFGLINIEDFKRISGGISGLVNMVVFGLLISRLDSKLIGLPSWLVCILFFYAAVQPLDIFFGQKDLESRIVETICFVIVLVFKAYFFFIITYLLQTGRLRSYFSSIGEMNIRLENSRKEPDKMSFSEWLTDRKYILIPLCIVIIFIIYAFIKLENIVDLLINILTLIFCIAATIIILIKKKKIITLGKITLKDLRDQYDYFFRGSNNFYPQKKLSEPDGNLKKKVWLFFKRALGFFILLSILYVLMILKHCFYTEEEYKLYWSGAEFIINTLSALFVFYCFTELFLPSIRNEEGKRLYMYWYGATLVVIVIGIYFISMVNRVKYHEYESGEIVVGKNMSFKMDTLETFENPILFNNYN
ncbi:MAG TPA: hypothetical protein VJY62_22700, partial [Bacteroidia bacterium]|nr:hypothetical protein [Bacteroidia bacterium]